MTNPGTDSSVRVAKESIAFGGLRKTGNRLGAININTALIGSVLNGAILTS